MGKPLKEEIELDGLKVDREFINPFDGKVLVADIGKDFILEEIRKQLEINSQIDTGNPDTNTTNPDNNDTTGGGGGSNFDFTTACSITDLPEPLPEELSTSINTIIEEAGDTIAAAVVCPLIQTTVTAYNLANGGGLPGGIGFD